ncbi:MAG: hypothetical protein LH477_08905 [Nocardioides sp.]|nr:hypothetical protein [Nocardioides sp.]
MSSTDSGIASEPLAAVMVCDHGGCLNCGPPTLEALRPLVARTPRAILIRTGCLHPSDPCPASWETCAVRLQHCTDDLSPLGPSVAVIGTTRATFRQVQAWLDQPRP